MPDIASLIQQGSANLWLFIPSAILLGALHGLEPGHSKTMMAAFIVAVRGTVKQAVLLGLAATISHTAVVWLVALLGLWVGGEVDAENTEPYFQMVSGGLIVLLGGWMAYRTWQNQQAYARGRRHHHGEHHHHHHHEHHHEHHHHGHHHHHHHEHSHNTGEQAFELATEGYQDAHERAHAEDIRKRFSNREVSTGQIVLFGLTGGLIPCPASITVLLICLQLKKIALGALLVVCFSIGLALTLVAVGVVAALSVQHIGKRSPIFSMVAARAPYLSALVIALVGVYVIHVGWSHWLAYQLSIVTD